jgi:steroid 5-alpha reductase family enzyme
MWVLQEKTKNASFVDIGWTAGTGLLGMLYAFKGKGEKVRRETSPFFYSIISRYC